MMQSSTSSSLTDRLMGVVTFKAPVYKDIARDPNAMQPAGIIVIVTAFLTGIVSGLLSRGGLIFGLLSAVLAIVLGWVVGSWLTAFVAKTFFQGTTTTAEMMRVRGHAYIFNILGVIPIIGGIIGAVLGIIANVLAIREASGLDTTKSVLTAIIVGVIVFIALGIITAILGGIFLVGAAATGQLSQ